MSKPKKRKSTGINRLAYKPCICEALAMFEALRRLGFSADDIFCAHYPNETAIILKTQGKEFIITCGNSGMSTEKFRSLWTKACAMWNGTEPGMSTKQREVIFEGSIILRQGGGGLGMVAALQAKGFDVPIMQKLEELAGRPQAGTPASFVNSKGGQA